MTFKRKIPKIYTQPMMEAMNRDELNTVAISVGHMPSEETGSDDLINEILVAQDGMMRRLAEKHEREDREKEEQKKEAQKRHGKSDSDHEDSQSKDKPVAKEEVSQTLPAEIDDERIWFKVSAGEGKMGKAPLFAALNGESILVKRGEWVKLKKKFINVLNDAVVTEVDQDRDGEKSLRDVPRFNYQIRSLAEGQPVETKNKSRSSF